MYVHYPFHPLRGRELRVFVAARSADGAVTVEDAAQKRLKIPLWMVAAEAGRFELTDAPTIEAQALLRLVDLCELHRGTFSVPKLHLTTEPSHAATLVDQTTAPERIDVDA